MLPKQGGGKCEEDDSAKVVGFYVCLHACTIEVVMVIIFVCFGAAPQDIPLVVPTFW
jgi:hypothetical protein